MVSFLIFTSVLGRSPASLGISLATLSTTSWPLMTSPKMVCLLFSQGVGMTVMKNWEPLVLGPGVRHGQQALLVELAAALELVLELEAGAAGAAAQRVAALHHEVLDAAVEDRPVVEGRACLLLVGGRVGPRLLAGGQPHEVLHRLGRVLRRTASPRWCPRWCRRWRTDPCPRAPHPSLPCPASWVCVCGRPQAGGPSG